MKFILFFLSFISIIFSSSADSFKILQKNPFSYEGCQIIKGMASVQVGSFSILTESIMKNMNKNKNVEFEKQNANESRKKASEWAVIYSAFCSEG